MPKILWLCNWSLAVGGKKQTTKQTKDYERLQGEQCMICDVEILAKTIFFF